METEYTDPGNNRDDNQLNKEQGDSNKPGVNQKEKATLENSGPNKNPNNKVLNQDGSLGDLPDQDVPGGGALEGTVGLGT